MLPYVKYPMDQSLIDSFMIYVNDIAIHSKVFKFFLFADGTNLLYADKDLRCLKQSLILQSLIGVKKSL